ncbi:hypothetical protein LFL96_06375 [Paraburkholderia sp. D15]|uniref:hypothetical protein n=1 Tax=Paraburkholderia sp. D15 TaxID=2880218 RepID=UPI00247AE182|nr:hypothetical protein [Paraburkholderia sp. D15]WGS51125.1 hypothetical protein LFL96_06375 [Paraburkholderia sp. D15]
MPDTIPTLNITISKGFRKLPNGNTLGFWPEPDGVVMQEWQGQDGKGDLLSQETYDYGKYAQYRAQHPDLKLPDLSAPKTGNTVGKVVGETSVTLPTITVTANPPPKPETATEVGFWGAVGGWVHGGLDAAGLIPGLGAVPDLLNAGIYAAEGDFVNAGISAVAAIPVVGDAALAGKYAVKGAELAVKESEKLAAKETEKLAAQAAKEAEEKAAKEAEEKAAEQAEKKAGKDAEKEAGEEKTGDGKKVKQKKKMKCGEYGRYGKLKQKTGDNKFDRDHIPSKAALKERAKSLLPPGKELSPKQAKAIDDWGEAIAIPRQAHIDVSPTYGQTLKEAAGDAKDLAGSARRDVEAMLGQIDEYDADGGCRKKYQKAAAKIMRMDNAAFDKALKEIVKRVK